jgi:DNA-binding CsgD family transcriptional regulator
LRWPSGWAPSRHRRRSTPDRPRLSGQELNLLLAYAAGLTLDAAARRTGILPATAEHYLERIKEKYRSAGRPTYTKLDLATRVREDGLLRCAPTQRTARARRGHQHGSATGWDQAAQRDNADPLRPPADLRRR